MQAGVVGEGVVQTCALWVEVTLWAGWQPRRPDAWMWSIDLFWFAMDLFLLVASDAIECLKILGSENKNFTWH